MKIKENNYAFIDSQNVNLSIRTVGWRLDWPRFRIYLKEKYGITKAFLFIGYVHGNEALYKNLQNAGFVCIFKPTLEYKNGETKGNVDAEMVLHSMIEYPNYDKAVIISGDGDFYCLAEYLIGNNKLKSLLIPNKFRFSALLKFKICQPYLRFMNELESKLDYKKSKKGPVRTEP
ncbi:MAG: NYN domain-containing protein [Candidatus Parcubacteria bacterium]|nr:NYN domain-containing protein [Candidatus Parcubacteria bacterium]